MDRGRAPNGIGHLMILEMIVNSYFINQSINWLIIHSND